MNEIICPNCKKAFKVDEAGFAEILKQVRDHEFEKELHEREEMLKKDKENAVKLAEANITNTLQKDLAKKQAELLELKAKKDREHAELDAKKKSELAEMKSKINNADLEKKLAVTEAVNKIEKERDELAGELKSKDAEKQLLETSLKEKYATELKTKDDIIKMKDEEIALRKDMKVKLSTKMVGEKNQNKHTTARRSLISFAQLDFKMHISKKTTTQQPVARATTYTAKLMKLGMKSYRSCS